MSTRLLLRTDSKGIGTSIYISHAILIQVRPLKVGLPQMWDPEFGHYLRGISAKDSINMDHNSGNPLGMAICQVSALDGRRTTASDALLHSPPANLKIMTNSAVDRIIFDRSSPKAIGVELSGKKCSASGKPVRKLSRR